MANKTTKQARIDAQELRQAIGFAAKIIERRNTIPVLGMVKIEAKGSAVTITATDLDIYYSETISAEHIGEFSFLVRLGAFQQLLKYADGVIEIKKTDVGISIENCGLKVLLSDLIDPLDFPSKDKFDANGLPFSINQGDLLKVIQSTIGAVSKEVTRYYLNGIHIDDRDGFMMAEATDGHRLIRYSPKLPWHAGEMILPVKACKFIAQRIKRGGNMPVKVTGYGDKEKPQRVGIEGDGWSIYSKLIDGTFPDTDRLIGEIHDEIDVTLSHDNIRRLPPLGNARKLEPCVISGDEGTISIKGVDGEFAELPVIGRGPAVGFCLGYIKDLTRSFGMIRIRSRNASDPARITVEDPSFSIVLMPMRIL